MRLYINRKTARYVTSAQFSLLTITFCRYNIALAEKVLDTLENKESRFHTLYPDEMSLEDKIGTIAREIYGARGVVYEPAAKRQLAKIASMGFGNLPVCMAKNQYSLSDDAKKLGRPVDFDIHIREV